MNYNQNLENEYLKERANKIFEEIPKNKWTYYHKKSIDNFIFYLPKIKGKTEKKELAEIIVNYLDEVEGGFEDVDIELSKYLYNTYLSKLVAKFQWRLGFASIYPKKSLIVVLPSITVILLLAYSNKYVFYTLLFFLILYNTRILIKLVNRKVYGFGY